jgi:hypothetical protein
MLRHIQLNSYGFKNDVCSDNETSGIHKGILPSNLQQCFFIYALCAPYWGQT